VLVGVWLLSAASMAQTDRPTPDAKQIQVKAELMQLEKRLAEKLHIKLGTDKGPSVTSEPAQDAAKLVATLRDSRGVSVNSPIITTLDNQLAFIGISSALGPGKGAPKLGIKLTVRPHVLEDGEIALSAVELKYTDDATLASGPGKSHELTVPDSCLAEGAALVVAGPAVAGKVAVLILTAHVIKPGSPEDAKAHSGPINP
jgi:hypothetical protein